MQESNAATSMSAAELMELLRCDVSLKDTPQVCTLPGLAAGRCIKHNQMVQKS